MPTPTLPALAFDRVCAHIPRKSTCDAKATVAHPDRSPRVVNEKPPGCGYIGRPSSIAQDQVINEITYAPARSAEITALA